jgi:biopolymer transport protein ExbD
MKNSRVLAVVMTTALTLITGCYPPKQTEFKDLMPQKTAEEISKAAEASPLSIIVTIDGEARLSLNKENAGTTEDLTLLKENLTQALEKRQAYLARVENGSPGAKENSAPMVFIRALSPIKYSEVAKVADAVKAVGGGAVTVVVNQQNIDFNQ